MNDNFSTNLKNLCRQVGVSGYEKESGIFNFLFKLVKDINHNTKVDTRGNIISIIDGPAKTILIEAHMDEVGFLVNNIDKNKNIFIMPRGIIKEEEISNNRVYIIGKNIKGRVVSSGKNNFIFIPIDKNNFNDIKVGDIVAFKRSFYTHRESVKASALDNRIGCSILLEVLKNVVKRISKNKLIFIFSVKEEVSRSNFKDIIDLHKDAFAIVVDIAYADNNDIKNNLHSAFVPKLGSGCTVQTKRGEFVIPKNIIHLIKKTAKENNIKFQEEKALNSFGKNNLIKIFDQGIKHGVAINIPVKNQHQQIALANLNDIKEAIKLLLALTKSVNI